MKKNHLSFSICMPIYHGSHLLKKSLDSIFNQSFKDYEIIIGDNNDLKDQQEIKKTKDIIKSYRSKKIKYFKNKKNLGYPLNLKKIVSKAQNDVIFLMAHDDILAKDALQKSHDAFFLDENIGVVTRPYFWFMYNINQPVRAVLPLNNQEDQVISISDSKEVFLKIFESVGQLSGLCYMRKYLEVPFHKDVFPAHIYPFAGILRKHKCVFLKDYTVAVGIIDSQTRSRSSIYDLSPTLSWIKMYKSVFKGEKSKLQRHWGVEHICTNFEGLIQLKNYAHKGVLLKEIYYLFKHRPLNLLVPKFWFYSILSLFIPSFILRKLTDYYKKNIVANKLPRIKFQSA